VVVTFDDAYRSVMKHAYPILSRLGVPGTIFAPTSFIGSEQPMSWDGISQWAEGAYGRELVPMSWPELGRLAESGWEVGSHTRTHPRLPDLDAAALREELEGSRLDCEARIGYPCTSLAYPFGRYDRATMEAANAAGYRVACAVARYVQQPVPMAWPRVGVYRGDGDLRFRIKVSPIMRRLRTSRVWQARVWLRGAVRKVRRQP
jgi:peptidoglycan/xylan/chitin deacetylase (PgdA/CDA1 family)